MSTLANLSRSRLEELSGYSFDQLTEIAQRADRYYVASELEIRGKTRRLRIPDSTLMLIQRAIHRHVLRDYPWHEAAYCCKGRGAILAAKRHVRHPWLYRVDLSQFFPSVRIGGVRRALSMARAPSDIVATFAQLVTLDNELPQGAPTSMAIGNLVLQPLDVRLHGLCHANGFSYTRYVDDIAISGGSRIEKFIGTIRGIVLDCGWEVNERKSELLGPSKHHKILGILVNSQATVDPDYIAEVRRALRAPRRGALAVDGEELVSLRGKIAWISAVNGAVGARLLRLYEQRSRA